jgi:hypothetical protein
VLAGVLERKTGASDELLDGRRDKDARRRGQAGDSGADRSDKTTDLAIDEMAFPGVDADPDVDAESRDCAHDRLTAADRIRRGVEDREEPVAGSIDLAPAEPR